MTMNDTPGATELGDADLVLRARSGDASAFGELWRRHYRSGVTVARSVSSSLDADDLVQEAYTRIYQSIQKGGGPTGSFRAYLFTSIRNTAAGWGRARKDTAVDVLDTVEDPATTEQATDEALDRGLTHQAFRSLPTRWQEVLWYSEIEGMKPAEIAPLLGLKATAVAQLTFRAREGLREAWIQAHLRSVTDGSPCQWTIERLGAYARSNLGRRDHGKLESHLAECTRCTIVASEAKEVGSRLALVLLPLTIGTAGAAGYLASLQGGGAPLVALAAMPSTVVEGAVTIGGSGAATLAPAGSAAGSGGAQSLLVPVGPASSAASLGGSASTTAAVTSGGAAAGVAGATVTGGALSGIGAITGIAAASLLVAGSVVTAAVIVPALTSSPVSAQNAIVETVAEAPVDTDEPLVISTPAPTPSAPLTEPTPPAATVPSPDPRETAPRPSAPPVPAPTPPAADPATPTPTPAPDPDPTPTPDPEPTPTPDPEPTPDPDPTPDPEPTDPPEPVLPEGTPAIDDVSTWFEGTRLTIGFDVTGDPGTQVHVTYSGADRGILTLDGAGAAPMILRPTVLDLLIGARLQLQYIAGDQTGLVQSYNVQDLVSLGDGL
ncbi:sigma-70 family RNA polymerase sigma factor [Microbacterium sp. NPDC055910]|uniref:sigma-70 family RNA polymerase sigma factor n=1 Tax=Microbacterium sp. NPDC055910 TaxID=3345659 RepID=UPI0035DF5571